MRQVFLDMFFGIVREKGAQLAVTDPVNGDLSFGGLAGLSGKVCRFLNKKGIGKEDFVVIALPRSIYTVAAMIGIMRSGAAFTVTEPGFVPPDRMRYIINDCHAALVIDEACWDLILQEEEDNELTYQEVDPHDAAYMIYTSGSTGAPKGCLQEYGGYEYMMKSADFEGKPPISGGIYALVIPMSMLATQASLMFTLAYGVSVDIVPLKLLRDPAGMAEYFISHHITSTSVSPLLARIMSGMNLNLEHVAVGSESADGVFIKDCLLINYYASSECGCMACAFRIDHPYERTPIGKPQFDLKYRIRKLDGEDTPGVGELMLYLPYFRGYNSLPEESARVLENGWFHTGDLVQQMEDMNLVLLGRIDNMIKINGNRVEPEEVESAAARILGLGQAAVRGFGEGDHAYVCLYYAGEKELDPHEANEALAAHLPYYMLPSAYVKLPALPKLPSGKVDRRALKPPVFLYNTQSFSKPQNETEAALCQAMAEALNLPDFSVEDDFYLMGGDSLGTITVIEGSHLPGLDMYDMLDGRTPRKIAQLYRERMAKETRDVGEENREAMKHAYPLTPMQRFVLSYRSLKPDSNLFVLSKLVKYSKRLDMKRMEEAVWKLIKAHPALMTAVHKDADGNFIQSFKPELFSPVRTEYLSEAELERKMTKLIPPLDLYDGELYRIRLFSTQKADYSLVQICHFLVDGTSFGILFSDLMKAYNGEDLPTDTYYLRLKELEEQKETPFYREAEAYFKNRYAGRSWDMLPHPDGDGKGLGIGTFPFSMELPKGTRKRMKALHKLGANAIFSTALGLSLAVYNNSEHVLTAWGFHGRKNLLSQNIVGLCYRNLPIAMTLNENLKLSDLYVDVRDQMTRGVVYDCYDYNRGDVVPLRDDRAVLFYQDSIYRFDIPKDDISFEVQEVPDPWAAVDNAMEIEILKQDEDQITLDCNYNSDMFKPESIQRFCQIYTRVVMCMLGQADSPEYTFGMLRNDVLSPRTL